MKEDVCDGSEGLAKNIFYRGIEDRCLYDGKDCYGKAGWYARYNRRNEPCVRSFFYIFEMDSKLEDAPCWTFLQFVQRFIGYCKHI